MSKATWYVSGRARTAAATCDCYRKLSVTLTYDRLVTGFPCTSGARHSLTNARCNAYPSARSTVLHAALPLAIIERATPCRS